MSCCRTAKPQLVVSGTWHAHSGRRGLGHHPCPGGMGPGCRLSPPRDVLLFCCTPLPNLSLLFLSRGNHCRQAASSQPLSKQQGGCCHPLREPSFHCPAGRGPEQSSFPWGWSGAQHLPSFSSFWVSGPHRSGDFPGAGKGEVKHPLGADGTFPDGWLSGGRLAAAVRARMRAGMPWPALVRLSGHGERCGGMFFFRHCGFIPKR